MKYKKLVSIMVLILFSIYLTSPVFAGTFTLQWTYSDADGDPQAAWRWWFDSVDFSSATVKNTANNSNTSTTIDTTGLSDGNHTLYVQVSDGIEWSEPDSITVNVDTTNPDITIFVPSGVWENTDITVNIQYSESGSGISTAQYKVTTDENKPVDGWIALNSDNENIVLTENGQWYIHVQVIDQVGNEGYLYKGPYQIDKTLPYGTITSHNSGDFIKGTVTIEGTANDGLSGVQKVEVSTDNGNTYNLAVGTDVWSYEFNVPELDPEDTEYKILVKVTDNAGNEFISPAISLFKNSQAPVTTWTTAGDSYHNSDITLEGQSSDANIVDNVVLSYKYNDGPETPIATITNSANDEPFAWTHTFDFSDGDGNYTFLACATDKGGLTETPMEINNVIYDGNAPVITLDGPTTTVKENITITGSATDLNQSTVTITLDGTSVALDGSGNFTENLTLSPGTNTFIFEATDGAGNVSTYEYTVERSKPEAPAVMTSINETEITYNLLAINDVDGYEISEDGTNWTDLGNVLTTSATGLTPNTMTTRYFRSYVGTVTPMYSDSVEISETTLANQPTIENIQAVDYQTVDVTLGLNSNPANTEMQVQVLDGGVPIQTSNWSNNTTITFTGLEGNKTYTIEAKARNIDNIETGWVNGGTILTPPKPAQIQLTNPEDGTDYPKEGDTILINKHEFELSVATQAGVTYRYKLSAEPNDTITAGDPVYSGATIINIPSDGYWYLIIEGTNGSGTMRTVQKLLVDTTPPELISN